MDSRGSQPLTAPLTLPNSVGPSLLADDDIVSFLSRQNSQSSSSEDLEETSQDMAAPDESCSTNGSPDAFENDSAQADPVKLTNDALAKAASNRRAWTMEIVALCVAVSSLISIYAVLGALDNKQQPQWPLPATLNLGALIALLATVLRSMVMEVLQSVISQMKWRWFKSTRPLSHLEAYDEASRGPWGAVKFIPLFRLCNWATLGAFVSALSIAISTLTQQAFQTSACSQPISDGDASIPIAQTCLGGARQTTVDYDSKFILDPRIKAALISGLAGVQLTRPLTPTCSSGNCTFPALNGISYSSVVISTECIDVSPFVNQSGALYWDADLHPDESDWVDNFYPDHHDGSTGPPKLPHTQYTLPFGVNLSYSTGWLQMLSTRTLDYDFYEDFGLDLKLSQKQKITVDGSWAVVGMMMPTTNPCEDSSTYQSYFEDGFLHPTLPPVNTSSCPQLELPNVTTLPGYFSVTAAICWFYPTLQHFTGSIQQGSFQEQTIGDPIPLLDTGYLATQADPKSVIAKVGWSSFSDPCIIDGSIYVPGNLSDVPGGLVSVINDRDNVTGPMRCLYGLDYIWLIAIDSGWSQHFTYVFSPIDRSDCVPASNHTEMLCVDKWWLGNIYNGGNASTDSILHVLNQGLSSMSDQMRMMGTDWNGNPSNVSGTVYYTSICIEFHWEWLFFPLALVLATLLLLVAVMVNTRREVVWKSSILPLLFYGLEERQTMDGLRLKAEKELHATAKTRMVDFSFAKNAGWRFRKATGNQ